MFTGIVEAVGAVKFIEKRGAFGRIGIEARFDLDEVNLGDSISIEGVCLTVTAKEAGSFTADITDETLRLTTLGELGAGSPVNLERSLTLSKPLGGHLVTGHIDGVGVLKKKMIKGPSAEIHISVPAPLMRQVVKKGSIAVDGISLTVADIVGELVKIAVIPHTLDNTSLKSKKEGAKVNIETDIIGKYVEKFFSAGEKKGLTEGFLAEHGFIK
ncbi:MAG: riboflavin synthase [Deltaproteobacteria bacterium]|nr:riboflavin synthase [Deltaproteobacteria bacterium]